MPHADGQPVVVIGAGPAGLAAATALTGAGFDAVCLEARGRPGGRLLSTPAGGDLGATWFWDGEQRVRALVTRLGLDTFAQHTAGSALFQDVTGVHRLPGNPIDVPAHRYTAGAGALTDRMAATLPPGTLRLNTPVTAIRTSGRGLSVHTSDTVHQAGHVVLAVPPALALARIDFGEELPADLLRLASATPVWMGAVVKVVAVYGDAFWRRDGLAGAAFSHTGPLQEVHDMSGPQGSPAALFGFAPAPATGPGFRQAVIDQLTGLFGPAAARPEALHVQDWSTEHWTSPPGVQRLTDYSLFGHARYQQPSLNGRLHWASTETAVGYAGHVEGALAGGERAARAILKALPRLAANAPGRGQSPAPLTHR
ncbi:flavin monoamine oxidase family protein [Nonomuraea sp. NPDC050451]|uniref:flavin monoamine oxidase family protein n=1 Tax=Nonomuraea sp. NPDC050451 TaxID=3364364 RepID=UPI003789F57A